MGSAFGLAGNKYGWMIEVDPANPDDYGTKHTWLGRYRHEAVGIRAQANQPLVFIQDAIAVAVISINLSVKILSKTPQTNLTLNY